MAGASKNLNEKQEKRVRRVYNTRRTIVFGFRLEKLEALPRDPIRCCVHAAGVGCVSTAPRDGGCDSATIPKVLPTTRRWLKKATRPYVWAGDFPFAKTGICFRSKETHVKDRCVPLLWNAAIIAKNPNLY